MRTFQRALLAGGLGFAVAWAVAACGGSSAGLLSGNQANNLNNQLSQVSDALAAGRCAAAGNAARQFVVEVSNLPNTINSTLRENLDNGASTISQLVVPQCHPVSSQTTTTPTTTSTPTTTTTQTTTTAPTTTTSTTPTTTTTTTTPVTPPTTTTGANTGPSGGGGLGGGNGNGNGNGGGGPSGPPSGTGAGGNGQ